MFRRPNWIDDRGLLNYNVVASFRQGIKDEVSCHYAIKLTVLSAVLINKKSSYKGILTVKVGKTFTGKLRLISSGVISTDLLIPMSLSCIFEGSRPISRITLRTWDCGIKVKLKPISSWSMSEIENTYF